ncbi:MAG: RHS repeat-associated core domain-containing protein, partial [Segetibacter sp.]
LTVWLPEGGSATFAQSTTNPNLWLSTKGIQERLFQQGNNFFFQRPNGHRFRFEKLASLTGNRYRLQDIRDNFQNLYKLTYDEYDNLNRVTEPAGRYLEMIYRVVEDHFVMTQVRTSDGRSVRYNYSFDSDGILNWVLLTSVDYGDGTRATYSYYPSNYSVTTQGSVFRLLEHAVDPRYQGTDVNMRFTYDMNIAMGYIKEERNGKTGEVMATLNADDDNRWVCYANGRVQHYIMPEEMQGRTKEYIDGLGRSTKFTYDEVSGFIKTETDALGRVRTYTRTIYSNPLEIRHPDGSKEKWKRDDLDLVLTHADELGRVTSYTRDDGHRITHIRYADGTTEGFTYNDFGQVLTHTLRNGGTESNTYDNRGLKTRFTDALGNITKFTYDNADRLASVTNALGNTTKYEYNERGLLVKMINADKSSQSYTYDDFGNRSSTTNEIGNTWKMVFDEFKRLMYSTDPLNRVTQYSYDLRGGGCGCSHDNNRPTKITLPSGKATEITYDVEWQKRSETVGAGSADAATTFYEYDLTGNLKTRVDQKGKSWLYAYDIRNRLVSTTDPLGNKAVTRFDAAGNAVEHIRADGGTTLTKYDEMNRVSQTTDAQGQVTKMKYDDDGNMVRLTDANNRNYNFEYDLLDRRTKMTYPGSTFESYKYDGAGNLIKYTNRAGDVRTYTYDNRSREVLSDWSDNTPDVTRTYDAANRVLTLSSSVSVLTYTYSIANELISETQDIAGGAGAKTVSYRYNEDGLRDEMMYPGGTMLDYAYTSRNQIKTITTDGSPLVAYMYDLNGNRTNKALVNGTSTIYTYDADNRMLSVDNLTASTSFARFEYGYDNVNRRTFVKRDGGKGDVYSYNASDQLTSIRYDASNPESTPANPLRTVNYNWDATGNRTTVIDNGIATTYTTNNRNQYTDIDGSPLNYNPNGALRTFDGWIYRYDAQDRLIRAEKGSMIVRFAYDARNRRVRQRLNGEAAFFYYNGWNLIEEYNNSGIQQERYIHAAQVDEILAKTSSAIGSTVYYHYDALGSVTHLTSTSANLIEKYFYDVFGKPTITNSSGDVLAISVFGNRLMFTGQEFIHQIGLYDYRNRIYSSSLGRFLQHDPIRFNARDVNLYRYVGNNPVNLVDPTGTTCTPPQIEWTEELRATSAKVEVDDGNDGFKMVDGYRLTRGKFKCCICISPGKNDWGDVQDAFGESIISKDDAINVAKKAAEAACGIK